MTLIGIGIIIGLISITALVIERIHNHDAIWIITFIPLFIFAVASLLAPWGGCYLEIRKPEIVEKTTTSLIVQDSKYGMLHSELVKDWIALTNKVVVWKKVQINVYGYESEETIKIGTLWEWEIKHALNACGITNLDIGQTLVYTNGQEAVVEKK